MTALSERIRIDGDFVPADPAGGSGIVPDVFEQRLFADAAAGCQDSFRILVERYQDAVFRLCRQLLGCDEDAREVSQDTFVRAYQSLGAFEPRARFFTWLYRIAVNRSRDKIRARAAQKRKRPDELPGGPIDGVAGEGGACPRPAPDESLALAEDVDRLVRGLAALAPKLREALVLAAVEGLSHQECAEVLRCSTRAVEGRVYRARRELLVWWMAQA